MKNYLRLFLLLSIFISCTSLKQDWDNVFTAKQATLANESSEMVIAKDSLIEETDPIESTMEEQFPLQTIIDTNLIETTINPVNGDITHIGLKKYATSLNNQQPMTLLDTDDNNDLKYIAQTLLLVNGKPENIFFQAQNIEKRNQETIVHFVGKSQNAEVNRTYNISDNNYTILVEQEIKNISNESIEIEFENRITRKIATSNKSFNFFNPTTYSFEGISLSSDQKPFQKQSLKNMNKLTQGIQQDTKTGWIAMVQHYFVSIWIPNNTSQTKLHLYAKNPATNTYTVGIKSYPQKIKINQKINNNSTLYAGPIINNNLSQLTQSFEETQQPSCLNKLIDYGMLSFVSIILFSLMSAIQKIIGNWGITIIIITILIKIMFYPLSTKSYKSTAKIRLLQPRLKKLQEIYGEDRQRLGVKMLELYKKEKVNPASGFLPMLIQIPVFIALYYVISESVELRQEPFVFWIKDLSARDPYFILPILMGISMLVQQRINPMSVDPVQARIMTVIPIIFTLLLASFPSALILYWLANNVVSIFQQWYATKNKNC